jgi:hypothetical protein
MWPGAVSKIKETKSLSLFEGDFTPDYSLYLQGY